MEDILLIVHIESNDEVHYTGISYSLIHQLFILIDDEQFERAISLVRDNVVFEAFVQTYCTEKWEGEGYNIIKVFHFPELGY